jgi:RNA polymerase sigma-70 factor (ECF subfamily)
LWDAFKKGDELAFIRIYKTYSPLLYDYGCKYSQDKEMVRDCLHDFFLYLKKNKLGFGDTTSIKLYLFKSFRRRIVDYLKKNNYDFNLREPSEYSPLNVESSIEAVYINKQINAEQLEKLSKALNALDSKERKAIYYFYFKGLSYEQIAEVFNFAHVSSARRVMYRSLRQLRHFFSYS